MNKLTYFTAILLLTTWLATGCKKEEKLTASEDEKGYSVPQGTNAYDATIVDWFNKYKTYFLYKFTDKDTYWTPSGWKNATPNASGVWSAGYVVTQADTNYISQQLALLNKLWLARYSDKFLVEFLPAKIMLCASIDSIYNNNQVTPNVKVTKSVGAYYNYDNICINYGNAGVAAMTASDSVKFLARANLVFIQSIAARNLSAPTSAFTSIATYSPTVANQAAVYAQGIITYYVNTRTPQLDWNAYIEAMVSRSEANLNKSTPNTDYSYMGILNATKDSNGKIRQRYNLIRNYFINTYGVDLQAIGNAADK